MSSPKYLRRSLRLNSIAKFTVDSDSESSNSDSNSHSALKTEIEEQLEDVEEDVQKPLELFSEMDVSGRKLYGFETTMKRNSMMFKANQCRTPETPRSPKALPSLKIVLDNIASSSKRKYNQSKNVDKNVTRKDLLPGVNLSGDESISEGSEYVPTSENSSESGQESDEIEERVLHDKALRSLSKYEIQSASGTKRKNMEHKTVAYKDYHIKSDEYFESQMEKPITSDHTLGRLRNARLTEAKLEKLLVNQSHISTIHKKSICTLTKNYRSFFPLWQFIMEEGYSLLLYGLGSKRDLINDFHNKIIKNHPTLVVNGFFPSLSIKDILNGIIADILDLDCPTNPNDCLELVEKTFKTPNDRLYLIIHNIDGIMLRSNKVQNILASLAAISNIRILASVDHINAPLLWDHIRRAKFNFYWWDTTTFLPYQVETSYESSLLVQQSGALALSSLQNVFLSLTSNARAIYIILVKYQLNNSSGNYTGMPFKDLYRAAREQFLVSSDLALRAQLTEFIDHKLVKTKRNTDGAEHLTIPLDKSLLKQFLEQHGS